VAKDPTTRVTARQEKSVAIIGGALRSAEKELLNRQIAEAIRCATSRRIEGEDTRWSYGSKPRWPIWPSTIRSIQPDLRLEETLLEHAARAFENDSGNGAAEHEREFRGCTPRSVSFS
jgi:hypothetical protein